MIYSGYWLQVASKCSSNHWETWKLHVCILSGVSATWLVYQIYRFSYLPYPNIPMLVIDRYLLLMKTMTCTGSKYFLEKDFHSSLHYSYSRCWSVGRPVISWSVLINLTAVFVFFRYMGIGLAAQGVNMNRLPGNVSFMFRGKATKIFLVFLTIQVICGNYNSIKLWESRARYMW